MKNTHILYGFMTGLAMIIVGVILYIAGLSFKPGIQYIAYVPYLIGLIFNAIAFTKANDGFVTFGNVFSSCFKACAIITILGIAWSFISLMIFPGLTDKIMETIQQSMADKGMSGEKMDQAMEMTRKWFKIGMVGGIVLYYMFFGAIFSLIAAAIPKKKGPNPQMPL